MGNAIYKPEENKLVVTGTLTNFRYATSKFSGDDEHYQVSVQTSDLTPALIEAIKERYFSETKDKYLPSFIKDGENNGCAEPIFINLKSKYEFGTFVEGEGNKRYGYDDVIELGEGLAPLHSKVKLSMRLKDGAVYPLGLMITELNKQDAAEFFV